ncbi:MAG: nodulation protein NodU [Cytophagales bacterium]|nr:nodulation protein NodU [Cytophagales bacterium]
MICGLKLTHDGAVSVVDNNRLIFSIEMEKINNNPRYTEIKDTVSIKRILDQENIDISAIQHFVIDGWGGYDPKALAIQPRLEIDKNFNKLTIDFDGVSSKIKLAQYTEKNLGDRLATSHKFNNLLIGDRQVEYHSYLHACNHLFSAYCTSPFSKRNESSFILIWDGGMFPRLYYFEAKTKKVNNFGPIFLLIGNIYTIFSQHFAPFKVKGSFAKDDLSIAGKVMAYIAKGKCREELFDLFDKIIIEHYSNPMGFANKFANLFKGLIKKEQYSDEDILLTFHSYLERTLIQKLKKKIDRNSSLERRLCIVGGCALNIKWNSAIRNSGLFSQVYVPPFPNDSGSAIGAACSLMVDKLDCSWLDWNVYSGPRLNTPSPLPGWTSRTSSVKELAQILHYINQPVVLLNDRAELGPRSLGNRSIVAAPQSKAMQTLLNKIKEREDYRPVSPVCLEENATSIFEPGTRDPYMLFDHKVKNSWKSKIAAVCHIDGTARLQTVNQTENDLLFQLLKEYKSLSNIPMLCNTSANYKGRGFFPDVQSAMEWNKVNYVWSHNILYEKSNKIQFLP